MAHCNNGCSELDGWVGIFSEFAELFGIKATTGELYEMLYRRALDGDADCGGLVAYNFLASEPVANVDGGAPMYFRRRESRFDLPNFIRSQLYATIAPLKLGMDILLDNEGYSVNKYTAHGGLFKVEGVAQQMLADALGRDVTVAKTAGEGGAYGMALLAAYSVLSDGHSLADWLDEAVYNKASTFTLSPCDNSSRCFDSFMELYKRGLSAQRAL